jgi:hypothetical protein
MSLRDWQAVPTPPGAGPDAIPICNDQDRTVRIPGYPLSVREVADGVVVCSFKARFGHDVETHSVDIGGGFRAYNVAYIFRRRRLDEMRFTASTDAYGHIRGMFDLGGRSLRPAAFPAKITLPCQWRVKGHRVRIAPGPDAAMLTVDIRR